jgi:SAM-dependent methyltransferase
MRRGISDERPRPATRRGRSSSRGEEVAQPQEGSFVMRCLACEHRYAATSPACPHCGQAPARRDGLPVYAPELADGGGGFDAALFAELASREAGHFWFRHRNRLILGALHRHGPATASFLEIGCGTGFVLAAVAAALPQARVAGSEVFVAGLRHAAARLPARVALMQMDARRLPFAAEFEAIGAFDVLEHIDDDRGVLREIHRALTPGGLLLLTVPQHRWLWSAADEVAHHRRRYTAGELHGKLAEAGFAIVDSVSFMALLLPAMAFSRLRRRRRAAVAAGGLEGGAVATALNAAEDVAADPASRAAVELDLPRWLDALFARIVALEAALIERGVRFPAGGSRLVVARKSGESR